LDKDLTEKSFKVQGWKKRGGAESVEYEKPLAVDMTFEELIKLSVTGIDKKTEQKSN